VIINYPKEHIKNGEAKTCCKSRAAACCPAASRASDIEQPTYSNATPNNQPTQLIEMAGLEIRRRALSEELAHVNSEMSRLDLEIRVLGIEIPEVPVGNWNPVYRC
jgi:hypothetical protein